jgi:hypothetical protein
MSVGEGTGAHTAVTAMFGNLKARWRQARGTQLKRQFENATRWVDDLGDEQAERFGRGLNYLFVDWVKRFGPVKDCDARTRKFAVRQMRNDARRRYERDIGASYALEFLSYHIEASYLPGEDATFVYNMTLRYVSEWAIRREMETGPDKLAATRRLTRNRMFIRLAGIGRFSSAR